MFILFVVFGYGVGLFYLMRQGKDGLLIFAMLMFLFAGWVLWKQAAVSGIFVGFLILLSSLNELPLTWMDYDTAESASTFVINNIVSALSTAIGSSIWFFLSYMAAESLSRRAFPHHPQIWKLWDVAETPGIIGRVVCFPVYFLSFDFLTFF